MSTLMDSVVSSISPDLIRSLASKTGEPAEAVQKGVQTGAAAMLSTLASRAQEPGLMSQVMSLASSSGVSSAAAAAAAGSATTSSTVDAGSRFLDMIFESNLAAAQNKVASASGLASSAGGTVLSAGAPLVLSALAQRVSSGNLSATGLGGVLSSEADRFRNFLPAGFAIPGMAAFATGASGVASSVIHGVERKAGGLARFWPLLLLGLLLLAGLIWYFNRGGQQAVQQEASAVAQKTTEAAQSAAGAATSAVQSASAALGDFFKRKLPNGVELNIPQNGIENKLVTWIDDPNTVVDKETWFDFDRLTFATDSATLEPSSAEQLTNIANILKAYPKVHVRVGGYTDNTGDAAANLKLSDERAKNVMAELVKLGVDPARMDAKGYGEEHPVADNATEEGRAKNRRISMRVTAK